MAQAKQLEARLRKAGGSLKEKLTERERELEEARAAKRALEASLAAASAEAGSAKEEGAKLKEQLGASAARVAELEEGDATKEVSTLRESLAKEQEKSAKYLAGFKSAKQNLEKVCADHEALKTQLLAKAEGKAAEGGGAKPDE